MEGGGLHPSSLPIASGWIFWGWFCSRKRCFQAGISSVPALAARMHKGVRAHLLAGSQGGPTSLTHVPCHHRTCLAVQGKRVPQNGGVCGAGASCCDATRRGHWCAEAVSVRQTVGLEREALLWQSPELGAGQWG